MNLFFLDHAPMNAARAHMDKHVVKMVTETAQLLSTALHEHGVGEADDAIMKRTHVNHPMAIWVRENRANFLHTVRTLVELLRESDYRFGTLKRDGTVKHARARRIAEVCLDLCVYVPAAAMTAPPQCMPPDFRGPNTIEAYRAYYRTEKAELAKWTKRQPPIWWSIP